MIGLSNQAKHIFFVYKSNNKTGHFLIMFVQYNAQEPLKIEGYLVRCVI